MNIVNRFKEPSSWAGIAVLMSLAGAPTGLPELVTNAGAGVAALLAFFMSERAK